LVPVLFTIYIQSVLKFKCKTPVPKIKELLHTLFYVWSNCWLCGVWFCLRHHVNSKNTLLCCLLLIIAFTDWISIYSVVQKVDSNSYVYISWTIHGMWMIYITLERGGPKFSNTTNRELAFRTAVQQRHLRTKWLLCSTRFFAFVSSLKLSRRLLCSVRFVLVSTFNLQSNIIYIIFVTSSNFEI